MEITKIQKIHHEFQVIKVFLKKNFSYSGLTLDTSFIKGNRGYDTIYIFPNILNLGLGLVLGFDRFGS